MTQKTSFFNRGIFLNTLRRFKWGSILYFLLLFFSVPFMFLVQNIKWYTEKNTLLLRSDYMIFPVLMAITVPTVVAVLVYRYVHSSKQGIANHALPVTRKENFITTTLAGFTLMFVPVLLNGIILTIMSFVNYGMVFSPKDVLCWILAHLCIIIIMFAAATFSMFLTGHAVSGVVINLLVVTLPMLIALVIYLISDIFLYGFTQSESFVAEEILQNTPVVWIFNHLSGNFRLKTFSNGMLLLYLAGSTALFFATYYLYKNRKIETCEDVAGFKFFRPVLKYLVTATGCILLFSIFINTYMDSVSLFILVGVLCAVIYFATEMLMRKTFKVFGSYKGYLGFVAAVAAFIAFFAYTNVFGYETRVPEFKDINKAAVYVGYMDREPLVGEEQLIKDVISSHEKILEDIPVTVDELYYSHEQEYSYVNVVYELKNGKELKRRYKVKKSEADEMLTLMYNSDDYKYKVTVLDNIKIENVREVTVALRHYSSYTLKNQDAVDLMKAVKKDIQELSYREIEKERTVTLSIDIDHTILENNEYGVFIDNPQVSEEEAKYRILSFRLNINDNFKNTIDFLKEKGYYEDIVYQLADKLYICKIPAFVEDEKYSYKEDVGIIKDFSISYSDCEKLEIQDAMTIARGFFETEMPKVDGDGSYYLILFREYENDGGITSLSSYLIGYKENELPAFLKKYVE